MKGVLLVNLGSPDSTNPKDVKRYLDEFLMDPRVIDVPYAFRSFLVRGIILNTRPKKSAAAYKKIWWEEGSPLIVLSQRLQSKVSEHLTVPVGLAMRYGSMSIHKGMQEMVALGVTDLLVIPLYPQFAMATTETIEVKVKELQEAHFPDLVTSSLPAFYNDQTYLKILSKSIKEGLDSSNYDHVLFSYHGVPERHIRKSDITKSHCKIDGSCCDTPSKAHEFCYRHQCLETTKQVANIIGLPENSYSTSFQSRLGFDPWLRPYTDRTIERMGLEGVKNLAIVTPAFVSDCLETLEEIAMEGQEIFHEVGGNEFTVIPCLNDREDWARLLADWVEAWRIKDIKTAIA